MDRLYQRISDKDAVALFVSDPKTPARRSVVAGVLYIRNRRRPTLPHSCPCSTIGAGERSQLFFEVRWPANQEDVRAAIQLYGALTSDAESRVISPRPKGVKRAAITSVFAMKRVEPLVPRTPNKKPSPGKTPDEGCI